MGNESDIFWAILFVVIAVPFKIYICYLIIRWIWDIIIKGGEK